MSRISEGQCGQFVNALNSCECTCNPASQSSWRMDRNFPAFSLENSFNFLFNIKQKIHAVVMLFIVRL